MPKSLPKTRKQITKKKGASALDSLHANSRDSQRLRRAAMRDDKLAKLATAKRKADQPVCEFLHRFIVCNYNMDLGTSMVNVDE
jgi:translation machinery-associated protein 16